MSPGQALKAANEKLVSIASALHDSATLFSEPMSKHTSFGIGGPCDLLVLPRTAGDAVRAWTACNEASVPCAVIGNGTNLLVRDGGVRGCLIKMAPSSSSMDFGSGAGVIGSASIRASSGTLLPKLVQEAMSRSLSGLEWAVGIPGSIGGAVAMNAGAYGGDFGSLVKRVEVAEAGGRVRWMDASELEFGYRHSFFSGRSDLLILSAEVELSQGDGDSIRDLMTRRAREREEKQPLGVPSAGSAFRRPAGHYVGPMIEELGLKGARVGGAQVSPKHAGFIVNVGGATSQDVESLLSLIQTRVKEAYGVQLEPEIVVMGEYAPEDETKRCAHSHKDPVNGTDEGEL